MSAVGDARSASSLRTRFSGPIVKRAVRDGLSIAGILVLIITMRSGGPGFDFFAYWFVDPADPYAIRNGLGETFGVFHYTPPLAWLAGPLKLVSWPLAYWIWFAILLAVLFWLARDWALAWLAFPPVASELYHGNIHLLIAAALVLSLRQPVAYLFLALSKVSPGVMALWWAARGEWRNFTLALGSAVVVVGIAFVLAPDAWSAWLTQVANVPTRAQNLVPVPLAIRLPVAAILVLVAARLDRPWILAPAVTLALPLLWAHGFAVLVAITPLLRIRTGEVRARTQSRAPVLEPS
jgi:uncharacterized protein YjeT (DUF2065 family)